MLQMVAPKSEQSYEIIHKEDGDWLDTMGITRRK